MIISRLAVCAFSAKACNLDFELLQLIELGQNPKDTKKNKEQPPIERLHLTCGQLPGITQLLPSSKEPQPAKLRHAPYGVCEGPDSSRRQPTKTHEVVTSKLRASSTKYLQDPLKTSEQSVRICPSFSHFSRWAVYCTG